MDNFAIESEHPPVHRVLHTKKIPFYRNRILINTLLLSVLAASLVTNQSVLAKNRAMVGVGSDNLFATLSTRLNWGSGGDLSGDVGADAVTLALAQGIPVVYGSELGVDFAQAARSMDVLKAFDPTYGSKKIALSGDLLQRYITVGSKIACEFCCGAKALVQQDGTAACGCAHSQAMRGLAAYLLQNHASEYTDDQILRELARWKGNYFPKAMVDKISSQLGSGQYTPDVAALLLDIKVPQYSGSSKSAPLPTDIKLPGQVGGC
ncbi:hypothetical protein HZA86_02915 [Candidatus Uhrbacteria bacterium]|nr:hypothetical protein [Candidatus Uhrbacteria bacterium]